MCDILYLHVSNGELSPIVLCDLNFKRYTYMTLPLEAKKRFATVLQIPEIYPSFTQPAIRWLLFKQKTNGFSVCVRKLGRKILIDLDSFEAWIDSHSKV